MRLVLGLALVAILAAAGASAFHLKIADGAIAAVFPQNQTQRAGHLIDVGLGGDPEAGEQ